MIVAVMGAVSWSTAHAGPLNEAIDGLASASDDKITESVTKLGVLDDPQAIPALDALMDDRLRQGADGHAYLWDGKTHDARDPLTGQVVNAPRPLKEVEVSNDIRRVADPVLAQLHLGSPDSSVRLEAAKGLSTAGSDQATALLHRALARERDPKVHEALALAIARVDLASPDANARLAALDIIARSANDDFLSTLQQMLAPGEGGAPREPDARVRAAATHARDAIVSHQRLVSIIGDLLHGLSLASVLLFAALGLAVTFGLLGVINMAHGEMLMLGAYATYSVQTLMHGSRFYVLVAIPVAFLATGLVGVLLERIDHPASLQATSRDAAGHLGDQPGDHPDRPAHLRGPERQRGQPRLAGRRRGDHARAGAPLGARGGGRLRRGGLRGGLVHPAADAVRPAGSGGHPEPRDGRLHRDPDQADRRAGVRPRLGDRRPRRRGALAARQRRPRAGTELHHRLVHGRRPRRRRAARRRGGGGAGTGRGQQADRASAGAVLGKIVVLVFIILFIQRRPQGMFALKGRVEA